MDDDVAVDVEVIVVVAVAELVAVDVEVTVVVDVPELVLVDVRVDDPVAVAVDEDVCV